MAADITALVAEASKAISIRNSATPDTDGESESSCESLRVDRCTA